MRITLKKEGVMKWLRFPYEYDAPECPVVISDKDGNKISVDIKVSLHRIDLWMSYPLQEFDEGDILVECEDERWIGAAYISDEPETQKRREMSRPLIHFMPPTGGISDISGIQKIGQEWLLEYDASPCVLSNKGRNVKQAIRSSDLLHWNITDKRISGDTKLNHVSYWLGDVEEQYSVEGDGSQYSLAKSFGQKIENLAGASIISVPAKIENGKIIPAESLSNLRVWERLWHNEIIEAEFDFLMRFKLGPDVWPEIKILDADNTVNDIQTRACEVELELFAGQETEIIFDVCGVVWKWDALDQTLYCGKYKMKVPLSDGRIYLHFFSDMVVQELFANTENAMLVLQTEGPQKNDYKIKSDLVENINNSSFYLQYNADPYIKIRTAGKTASIISMKVWGIRPTRYSLENRLKLKNIEKGEKLFSCEHYRIYENCVEDNIYGDPAAWALNDGETVLSPVRAVEEFRWRDTPWGDMTRIANRTEKWEAPRDSAYPKVHTKYAVLNAAFALATDIMELNRSKKYALPGQEGLMNAALFQDQGEGFGSWVRDTCHAAFRCQNLLAPEEARESLIYISEHGFNNGVDCAAMPAIAAWDYYIATGDVQILYEMLPGIIEYATEADERYDEDMDLVHATMCLAQDAFEEPENSGYCLGTEIAFSLMYQAAANICNITGFNSERSEQWAEKSKRMKKSICEKYWNDEKACFTSGPVGSEAYKNGWWELTGAEMVLWPKFGFATKEQTEKFLRTIQKNPGACSDFGINWYPFRKEKNHFWRACWVSWSLGISAAAGEVGETDFIRKLIFQQVRNVLLNKSFHEVMDYDTGRAWRWPHLPWHAAGFIGYIVNGVFGVRYDEKGLTIKPAIPQEFDGAVLSKLPYRKGRYTIQIHGSGNLCKIILDGNEVEQPFGINLEGCHQIDIYASK